MKNFIQPGNMVTAIAPVGGIVSGTGILIASLFGVAAYSAAAGEEVELATEGVFDLPKLSAQAWTAFSPVYWDATNFWCTTVVGSNKLIGVTMQIAANPSPIGRVRLNGAFIS